VKSACISCASLRTVVRIKQRPLRSLIEIPGLRGSNSRLKIRVWAERARRLSLQSRTRYAGQVTLAGLEQYTPYLVRPDAELNGGKRVEEQASQKHRVASHETSCASCSFGRHRAGNRWLYVPVRRGFVLHER